MARGAELPCGGPRCTDWGLEEWWAGCRAGRMGVVGRRVKHRKSSAHGFQRDKQEKLPRRQDCKGLCGNGPLTCSGRSSQESQVRVSGGNRQEKDLESGAHWIDPGLFSGSQMVLVLTLISTLSTLRSSHIDSCKGHAIPLAHIRWFP